MNRSTLTSTITSTLTPPPAITAAELRAILDDIVNSATLPEDLSAGTGITITPSGSGPTTLTLALTTLPDDVMALCLQKSASGGVTTIAMNAAIANAVNSQAIASEPVNGKNLITVGDSTSAIGYWQPYVYGWLGMNFQSAQLSSTGSNTGWSGYYAMAVGGTAMRPVTDSLGGYSIYTRSQNAVDYLSSSGLDIITVYCAGNDGLAYMGSLADPPLLNVAEQAYGSDPGASINTTAYPSGQPCSVYAAYRGMIEMLMAACPLAKIVVIAPPVDAIYANQSYTILGASGSQLSGLTYGGMFNTPWVSGFPAAPIVGEYYVCAQGGTIDSVSYAKGDAIIYNGGTASLAASYTHVLAPATGNTTTTPQSIVDWQLANRFPWVQLARDMAAAYHLPLADCWANAGLDSRNNAGFFQTPNNAGTINNVTNGATFALNTNGTVPANNSYIIVNGTVTQITSIALASGSVYNVTVGTSVTGVAAGQLWVPSTGIVRQIHCNAPLTNYTQGSNGGLRMAQVIAKAI